MLKFIMNMKSSLIEFNRVSALRPPIVFSCFIIEEDWEVERERDVERRWRTNDTMLAAS